MIYNPKKKSIIFICSTLFVFIDTHELSCLLNHPQPPFHPYTSAARSLEFPLLREWIVAAGQRPPEAV